MNFYRLMPVLGRLLSVLALLVGCSQQANYAPVIVNGQVQPKKSESKLADNEQAVRYKKNVQTVAAPQMTIKEEVSTESLRKYYVVKTGDTLYSIGISSGHGYEQLAQWNQIPSPYQVLTGQKLKLFKPKSEDYNSLPLIVANNNLIVFAKNPNSPLEPRTLAKQNPEISVVKIGVKPKKKSIISTDNKKMLKLKFAWPIIGRVAKNFHQSNKKGIDIAGKIGQKVRAAEAGKIAYSGHGLIGFGSLVIIKHNELYLSAYGNNSRLLVAEGDQVDKGQVIAQVGKALSKKPALHFEIRKNGKPVNPLKLLPKNSKIL